MAITTRLKQTWKEDRAKLNTAISSLKINMNDFKTQRKSEWKSFKMKFNNDMDKLEKSLLKMTSLHKK